MDDLRTITIDAETEGRIRAHVDAGEYSTAADVVRAGLDILEAGSDWTTEELREMIAVADREGGEFTAEEVEAYLDEKLRELEAKW